MPNKKNMLLEDLRDLCQVPSPSLHEREVAKVLAKKIREIGYEPLEDDAGQSIGGDCGNLIVKVAGTGRGPRLLLAAHIDTVEKPGAPAAKPRLETPWISREGGGILGADDKSGVAVLLEVLRRLKKGEKKHGDLVFAFTVAEEMECIGASEMDSEIYLDLDAGVVLDYSSPAHIVIAAPTKVSFRITVHGIPGHAAFPDHTINAAHVMAQTMARLPVGRLDEYTTSNLGIMRSGTAINVIPDAAYAEYELRSHRKDVLDFHVKRVIGTIEGVVRENRIFSTGSTAGMAGAEASSADTMKISYSQVDVDVEVGYEGFRLDENSRLVERMRLAVDRAGLEPKIVTAQGGSDANIFNQRGLESVVIGCGMYGAHGANERANIEDMENCADVLMHMISGSQVSLRRKAK